jgi:hypothetical protein
MMTVKRRKALETLLRRIVARWPDAEGHAVIQDDVMGFGPGIAWEEGPYEWAYLAASGGVDEEMAAEFGYAIRPTRPISPPKGWYIECITSWAVTLEEV